MILLKATKGKSQNRMSLKRQHLMKTDQNERFLDFFSSLQICLFEDYAINIVKVAIGHFKSNVGQA